MKPRSSTSCLLFLCEHSHACPGPGLINVHMLWRLTRCRTAEGCFGEECRVRPLVKSLTSCFYTSSSVGGPPKAFWIGRCFLHCLIDFLSLFFYPRSSKTKQLSWSRKYKADKLLLLLSCHAFVTNLSRSASTILSKLLPLYRGN